MSLTFDEQIEADIKGIFLKEFSQVAIHRSGLVSTTITVQFFEEPLEKMETTVNIAWCSLTDIPNVQRNDSLEVAGIVYGIVDFSPDEFQMGVNLFLQKI